MHKGRIQNVRYLRVLSNPDSYGHVLNSEHFIITDSFPCAQHYLNLTCLSNIRTTVNTDTFFCPFSVRINGVSAPCTPCVWQHSHLKGGSRIFRRGCTSLLLYFKTNKPHSFFFAEYQLYQKTVGHLRRGGGCAPPAPSPQIRPCTFGRFPFNLKFRKFWLEIKWKGPIQFGLTGIFVTTFEDGGPL